MIPRQPSDTMDLQSAKRTEPSLQIIPLPVRFVLKQYPRGEPLPGDVLEALQAPPPAGPALGSPDGESRTRAKAVGSGPSAGAFLSITATAEEWSLMRSARPDEADEAEWGCIRVRGPMELCASWSKIRGEAARC